MKHLRAPPAASVEGSCAGCLTASRAAPWQSRAAAAVRSPELGDLALAWPCSHHGRSRIEARLVRRSRCVRSCRLTPQHPRGGCRTEGRPGCAPTRLSRSWPWHPPSRSSGSAATSSSAGKPPLRPGPPSAAGAAAGAVGAAGSPPLGSWMMLPDLTTPATQTVLPMNDSLYGACHVELDRQGPMVLHVPADPDGRYFSVTVLDAHFTNVAHLGPKWTGRRGVRCAVGPARLGRRAPGRHAGDRVADRVGVPAAPGARRLRRRRPRPGPVLARRLHPRPVGGRAGRRPAPRPGPPRHRGPRRPVGLLQARVRPRGAQPVPGRAGLGARDRRRRSPDGRRG